MRKHKKKKEIQTEKIQYILYDLSTMCIIVNTLFFNVPKMPINASDCVWCQYFLVDIFGYKY